MKRYLLSEKGNFYKANLHCHSTVSDAKLSPEEIKKQYIEHGYSIVAFTDHDVLVPHNDLTDENFLALNGYEMEMNDFEDPFWFTKTCHLCLIALEPDNFKQVCFSGKNYMFGNSPKHIDRIQFHEDSANFVRSHTPECINEIINQGRDHGFFVTYNHPVWSLEEYSDYINYKNMHAMEICNFGACFHGYPDYNPKVYDDMLRAGKRIFCIAADDNHNYNADSFGGFTVIKAEKLEYRAITNALLEGNFYASQGPEIKELWYEDGKMHIKCSPAARIDFTSGIRWTHFAVANEGEAVEYACCNVPDVPHTYVRVTVTDKEGKHANTNAYFIDELNK